MSANVHRIAFTGELPWWIGMPQHDKGQWTQTSGHMTAAALMQATGMDFRLGTSPLLTYASKADYNAKKLSKVEGLFSIIRSDTQAPIPGVAVGPGYTPISFPEMFSVCDEVTSQPGFAHYETGGTLYDGRTGWCLIRLEKSLYIADDEIRTFLLGTTAHDGSAALRLKVVNTRVVCCNTFAGAMGESGKTLSIRHTKNYKQRIENAATVLRLIPKERAEFEAFAKMLLAKPITKQTYTKLIEVLVPVPDDTPDKPLTNRIIENVNAKRQVILKAVHAEDLEAVRYTAWGAYNAVADAEQHLLNTTRNHCDDQTKLARLFERSFERTELTELAAKFLVEVTV